jgi:hypothetical protein
MLRMFGRRQPALERWNRDFYIQHATDLLLYAHQPRSLNPKQLQQSAARIGKGSANKVGA